jgi:hypothetical protein
MSAHWWELWSPGLQAIGGIVELGGAGLLAYEWWRGTKETESSVADTEGASQNEYREPILEYQSERDEKFLIDSHPHLYTAGFFLIVMGIILQVAANGIAWGAAYGLFGAA